MSSKRDEPYRGKIKNPLDDIYGAVSSAAENTSIPIEQIQLPPTQPRRYFDPQAQRDLVQSVRQHGILQPLLVRPLAAKKYELVAGERRYRAAKEVGLTEVPIVERELTDTQALQLALIENLQRVDLNPIEEVEAIVQLLAIDFEMNAKDVPALLYRLKREEKPRAKPSGHNVMTKTESQSIEPEKSGHNVMTNNQLEQVQALFNRLGSMTWESFIKNRLPLLKLPTDILDAVMAGKIHYTKATALGRIKDEEARSAALEKVVTENWSLNQIKEHIKQLNPPPQEVPLKQRLDAIYQKARKAKVWDDHTQQERLSALLADLESLLEE